MRSKVNYDRISSQKVPSKYCKAFCSEEYYNLRYSADNIFEGRQFNQPQYLNGACFIPRRMKDKLHSGSDQYSANFAIH